jgi:ribonuclease J
VELRLSELLRLDGGLVVIIASGQNIDRAVSVYRAALATGRELVIDPYQAYILMTLKNVYPEAPQFDSPSVRVKFISNHVAKLKDAGLWGLACQMSRAGKVTSEQIAANPSKFVFLARSSKATSALLRYLAPATHPTIVWSQWRGYLDKGGPVQSFCAESGINPLVIHSGGHAHTEDLAEIAYRINPGAVVPIHTEAASQFAAFIPNVRIVMDGEAVEVTSLIAD